MIRRVVVGLALACLFAGCSSSSTTSPATTPPTTSAFDRPTSVSPAPGPADCFLTKLEQRATPDAAQAQCDLDALIDDIVASIRLRQGVADVLTSFGHFSRPMTAADVVGWEEAICDGRNRLDDLVSRARPTLAQQITLLDPLLDFAYDSGRNCPERPTLRDELSHQAWLIAWRASPSPTPDSLLKQQTQPPQFLDRLFTGARSPCDVVGNAAVIGVENWSGIDLPNLFELGLSTLVSIKCGQILD